MTELVCHMLRSGSGSPTHETGYAGAINGVGVDEVGAADWEVLEGVVINRAQQCFGSVVTGGLLDLTRQLCLLHLSLGEALFVFLDGCNKACLGCVFVDVVEAESFLRLSELYLSLLRPYNKTPLLYSLSYWMRQ